MAPEKRKCFPGSRSQINQFSRFEVSNQSAIPSPGLEYQFVYNKRFEPFVEAGLWRMSSSFNYAKTAMTSRIFSKVKC